MRKEKKEKQNKTLVDYVFWGKHESIAFLRELAPEEYGNKLGTLLMGVLVYERNPDIVKEQGIEPRAKFFYKDPRPYEYKDNSDIMYVEFDPTASNVISEVPLAIEVYSVDTGFWLKANSEEFPKARDLLKKYGIY